MDTVALLAKLEKTFALNQVDSKVLIIGLGVTGFSVARFFYNLGLEINFAVIDSRDKPPLIDQLADLMPDVPVFAGGFDKTALDVATHLIVSPGVSLNDASIHKAVVAGVKILSDIDLFACATQKPVIAITGSNGKSTVTTMLGEMGMAAGVKTAIGGNLGVPALDLLEQDADLYVLELSSFQLERTSALNAQAATVLNVSADHLDRHDGIMAYSEEKQRIFRGNGAMVLNADDPIVLAMQERGRDFQTFSVKAAGNADFYLDEKSENLMHNDQVLMPKADLPMEGLHNVANALAALALGKAVGLDEQLMCKALKNFKGLEHRMQKVAELNGISWVNDSKATNIGACVAALQGYHKKVLLIAGGDAKGADMQELFPVIKEKCKGVVLMGKDAELIAQALNNSVPVYFAGNMKEAVNIAAGLAEAGDSVLLSPACASLDQYKNYMARGHQFAAAVMGLAA
jgi:UDP-N-acetylmuramoylalanine--D-glutamate ligase